MNNKQWQERKNQAFARGIAVVNTDHSHPDIVAAVKAQVEAFSQTCVLVAPYASAVKLAENLNHVVPIEDARALFLSTGAEAVENAIEIARSYTARPGVIAFNGFVAFSSAPGTTAL